ncbi:hypothetical protein K435DRAFT_374474 [Dendrothele bispora CBS 962.96]|uniref:Uncharacterized protein n=1 Tax=Dendrothele bispora (strain CBS 962.96) TaxID=1314807 RepID=A0A4S8LAW1_DENBC|nr:hypothetical protein K435DRAFT_374474 [Dendrothele bispora CBS 962.96]
MGPKSKRSFENLVLVHTYYITMTYFMSFLLLANVMVMFEPDCDIELRGPDCRVAKRSRGSHSLGSRSSIFVRRTHANRL